MARNVYISCDLDERALPAVKSVQSFLESQGCHVQFAPPLEHGYHKALEKAIESCDSFVAIVGNGYALSTGLNGQLHYANALRTHRIVKRPRIFGIRIDQLDLPNCSASISVEWLDAQKYKLLLEDIPSPY
ncbi:MAG TPA: hypothetical protein VKN18_28075 [Blastocatellia bacterium]|nr:hypothetical protein [Blastocatellia bacterium]